MNISLEDIARGAVMLMTRLVIGANPDRRGWEPTDRPSVYFANHASHLDTLAVLCALPPGSRAKLRPAAAKDYWNKTALARFLATNCLRAVLLDRAPTRGSDPMAPLHAVLEAGDSLLIFPEGTRGDGPLADFKGGIHRLAKHAPEVDFVPVYIANLNRVLPKGSALMVPLACTVRFGPPLRLAPGEAKPDFVGRCRAALVTLSEEA